MMPNLDTAYELTRALRRIRAIATCHSSWSHPKASTSIAVRGSTPASDDYMTRRSTPASWCARWSATFSAAHHGMHALTSYVLAAGTVLGPGGSCAARSAAPPRLPSVRTTHDAFLAACRADPPRRRRGRARIGCDDGHDLIQLPKNRLRRAGDVRTHHDAAVLVSPRRSDRGELAASAPRFLCACPFSRQDLPYGRLPPLLAGWRARGRPAAGGAPTTRRSSIATPCPSSRRGYTSSAPSTAPRPPTSSTAQSDLASHDVERPKVTGATSWQDDQGGRCAKGQLQPTRSSICSALGERPISRRVRRPDDDYLCQTGRARRLTSRSARILSTFGSIPASARAPRRRRLARHPPLIADALNRQGFAVTVADDGQAALERAREPRRPLRHDRHRPTTCAHEPASSWCTAQRESEAARHSDAQC